MKLVLTLLLAAGTSAYGSTLVVNNNLANTQSPCNTAAFTTIGAAITAANPGDTVDVCPGTYPEAVYINKNGIKLNGLTSDNSSLIELEPATGLSISDPNPSAESPIENTILAVVSVSGVEIYNISVNGYMATTTGGGCAPGNAGIYFLNASGSIVDSAVAYIGLNPDGSVTGCQEGLGIFVESYGGTAKVEMNGTSVHDYDKNGITADGTAATLVATNNAVTGAGPTPATAQNGIQVSDGAKGTVNNNVVTGDDYTGDAPGYAYSASGILLYNLDAHSEINDNTLSDTNNAIYVYESNDVTVNGNNISKTIGASALASALSNGVEFEKNVIARAGLEDDQPAVYLCSSNNKVENNTISEALYGVIDDRTSEDGCSGEKGNTIKLNVYTNVGVDSEIFTDSPTPEHSLARTKQVGMPKAWPMK
ncbi:MAG: right-handed parallel beta-helix repeat-containing protein [Terracidiphilus sp.]|jgi:hypothetical protein